MENLGRGERPIEVPLPEFGPDELLVRHDACGLCFSDIKVIKLGPEHPRIFHDMRQEPVVLGHEVSMTVVGVGENLRDQYEVGDRFVIQADIYVGGTGYAYGYMIQGGLSKYGVIDQRILNGDDGNYLIPMRPQTGYAESALTEPWACMIASYRLEYRTSLKDGGTAWIVGAISSSTGAAAYTISRGLDDNSHPARLLLTNVPGDFARWLRERAQRLGVEVVGTPDMTQPSVDKVDDIVVLGPSRDIVETISPRLPDRALALYGRPSRS
jgi:NADPH:quinone reductase-like Zn-dependent oxidoreductase